MHGGCRPAGYVVLAAVIWVACVWHSVSGADINCANEANGCCCQQHIGNVDCSFDSQVDIADVGMMIDYLFVSLTPLPSPEQANLDGDLRGNIDIADLTALLLRLFITFEPFPPCPGPFNHPPNTYLGLAPNTLGEYVYLPGTPTPESGIPAQWYGEDRLDHPYDLGGIQCQWRLYGPYDSATYAYIAAHFIKERFTTVEGRIYPRGAGIYLLTCDTMQTDSGAIVKCDSVGIDRLGPTSDYGWVGQMLLVDTAEFASDSRFNRVAMSSATHAQQWTTTVADTLYDFLPGPPSDTTSKWWFIFWAQARDRDDNTVVDPSPTIRPVIGYEPRFEKGVLVVDLNSAYRVNGEKIAEATAYWQRAVAAWSPEATFRYYSPQSPSGLRLPAFLLMQHKVVVLYGDDIISGVLPATQLRDQLFLGMRAGASVWLTSRAALYGPEGGPPYVSRFSSGPNTDFQPYFGATDFYFTGWEWWQTEAPETHRIEDFQAARSSGLPGWPDLVVDTALLHSRYVWNYDWDPTLACPPEVNTIDPVPEAEILYTYDSRYDGNHPFVSDTFDFHGRPVGYRLQRDGFRTVVFTFTPVFLADDSLLQTAVDSVFNWLAAPHILPTAIPSVDHIKILNPKQHGITGPVRKAND